MIRINLLPPEVRRPEPFSLRGLGRPAFRRWIGLGIAASSVLLPAANHLQTRALAQWKKQWQQQEPRRVRWQETRKALEALREQAALSKACRAAQAHWAPRLNLLSDALVSHLWFTSVELTTSCGKDKSLSAGPCLVLKGSSFSARAGADAPVSRYLQRLKEQPDFVRWYRPAELISIEQRQVGGEQVSDFVILLLPEGG